MMHSRYVYLVVMVILFSWPIFIQQTASPLVLWLYPLTLWLGLIIYAFASKHHV